MSGSRVGLSRDDYLLSLKGRIPVTAAMEAGKLMHEEYTAHLLTPEEMGGREYQRKLRAGEEVVLKEVAGCSMVKAQRGKVDLLRIRRKVTSLGPEYVVVIEDAKLSFAKQTFSKGMLQLGHYGMIYGSPAGAYIHAAEREWWPIFLPEDEMAPVSVRCFLSTPNGGNQRVYPDEGVWFQLRNKVTEFWMQRYVYRLYGLLRQKRALNRHGIYKINLDREDRQMFLGKRKLLVKSPPKDFRSVAS